jgi:hypothetical protein
MVIEVFSIIVLVRMWTILSPSLPEPHEEPAIEF